MSSANVRLKAVRRLARRGSHELCLAEGARSVRAAFEGGAVVHELYVAPELVAGSRDADLVPAAERCGADVVELGAAAFASLAEGRPDGLLAVVARPSTALESLEPPPEPFLAVAVAIERPGNLGAIARTACAAGVDALLVADPHTDVFHRDAVRGSVGAVFRLPRACASSEEVLAWLRERAIPIVATTPAAADHVAVPAHGPVDSLNVAVAAGVVLCEAARAR